ncbi:MAG TPA: YihY/virulence factor BrkB family protein [Tepidisphaeraceae bacterium]
MARFKDLNYVLRNYGALPFAKRLYREINEDNIFTNAAAMAYAWIFAVFPFFIFLLSLLPYLPDQARATAKDFVGQILAETVTGEAAKAVLENVNKVMDEPRGGLLSFGLLLTIYAASGGMNTTLTSLDQAFDTSKYRSYLVRRGVAILLTVFVVVCLVIIMLMLPIGSSVEALLERYRQKLPPSWQDLTSGPSLVLINIARYAIGLSVMQIMIGVIYIYGPSARRRIRFFTPGSIFTGAGWILMGFGMRIYVESYANFPKTYGTVAGMVVLLMIFYLDAVILLIGAEIDSEIEHARYEVHKRLREEAAAT